MTTTKNTLNTKSTQSPKYIRTLKARKLKQDKKTATSIIQDKLSVSTPTIVKEASKNTSTYELGSKKLIVEKLYINGLTIRQICDTQDITQAYVKNVVKQLKEQAHSQNVAIYTAKISTDIQLLISSHSDRHTYMFREQLRVQGEIDDAVDAVATHTPGTLNEKTGKDDELRDKISLLSKLRSSYLTLQDRMIKNDSSYIDALTKIGVGTLNAPPNNKEPIHSDIIVKSQKSLTGLGESDLLSEVEDSVKRLKRYIKNKKSLSTVQDTDCEVIHD